MERERERAQGKSEGTQLNLAIEKEGRRIVFLDMEIRRTKENRMVKTRWH